MAPFAAALLPTLLSVGAGVAASQLMKPDTSKQDAEIAKQREAQNIAADRQTQALQAKSAEEDNQAGSLRRPRGRRLLLAATGEAGVSSTLGG